MKQQVLDCFAKLFGGEGDIRTYFAPGRVNLIGEHTDYNGGHVFPCALTIGTYMAARKREDRKLRFYSMNFEKLGVVESSLDEFQMGKEGNWTAYPKGMMWAFCQKGFPVEQGFDIVLYGNIPNGSGLSSSASVETVTGVMLRDMFGYDTISMIGIALYGQFSENNYNGVNCGIMDQFAIAMGKKDCAIFLDTSDLKYEYAPVKLEGARIVISCSNKKRGLGDSKYNERRSECETALAEIQKVKDIKSLGELTEEEFEAVKDAIKDPVRQKRAKHAVYENQRTVQAVAALKANDIAKFGELMNASHVSLRDDYEVTGIELDTLVEEAWNCPGVIGSRMTGAGFGSDLKYEYAPVKLEGARIVISCSNKKRGLGDSKYNERRSECETALAEIQKVKDIKSLGELTEEEFEAVKDAIKDPVRQKRAKHAVYENQRTVQAVAALKANDIAKFGELMNASHVSLRDDYEVTGIELDTLVEEAWNCPGVIGSRMTGAGFGGCTVSIVKTEDIDNFIAKVGAAYKEKIGYAADFYVVDIGDGAGVLK